METYSILINRKRAIIALVHSVFFLIIAAIGLQSRPKAGLIYPQHLFSAGNIATFCVYLIVTSVLVALTINSRCARERAYFAFCSASAGIGLLRALFGDPVAHVGPVARVAFLTTAVIIGSAILTAHSAPPALSDEA
jgi:hypothetical protein